MSEPKTPFTIVVGVDYSETGDLALEKALELSLEHSRAEVHAINVLAPAVPDYTPDPNYSGWTTHAPVLAEEVPRLQAYVQKKVDAFLDARFGAKAPAIRAVTHLRIASPTSEVAQLAADLEADLVVVGTHGRRGVTRWLLGSVAETTVRLAPCPVLVVRPKVTASPMPQIEPPCPHCVATRSAPGSTEYWCEQHRERHGQRHTFQKISGNLA